MTKTIPNRGLHLSNRTKVRCTKCHTRLIDRGKLSNGQWMLHLQAKGKYLVYIPFFVVMYCPNCDSIYTIDAEKGITHRDINQFTDRKKPDGSERDKQQSASDESTGV